MCTCTCTFSHTSQWLSEYIAIPKMTICACTLHNHVHMYNVQIHVHVHVHVHASVCYAVHVMYIVMCGSVYTGNKGGGNKGGATRTRLWRWRRYSCQSVYCPLSCVPALVFSILLSQYISVLQGTMYMYTVHVCTVYTYVVAMVQYRKMHIHVHVHLHVMYMYMYIVRAWLHSWKVHIYLVHSASQTHSPEVGWVPSQW